MALSFLPPDVPAQAHNVATSERKLGREETRAHQELAVLSKAPKGSERLAAGNPLGQLRYLVNDLQQSGDTMGKAELLDHIRAGKLIWDTIGGRYDAHTLLNGSPYAREYNQFWSAVSTVADERPEMLAPIFEAVGVAPIRALQIDEALPDGRKVQRVERPYMTLLRFADWRPGPNTNSLTLVMDPYRLPDIAHMGEKDSSARTVMIRTDDPMGYVRWLQKRRVPQLQKALIDAVMLNRHPVYESAWEEVAARALQPEYWAHLGKDATISPEAAGSPWSEAMAREMHVLTRRSLKGEDVRSIAFRAAANLLRDLDEVQGEALVRHMWSWHETADAIQTAEALRKILVLRAGQIGSSAAEIGSPQTGARYDAPGEAYWDYEIDASALTKNVLDHLKRGKKRLGTKGVVPYLREGNVAQGLLTVAEALVRDVSSHNEGVHDSLQHKAQKNLEKLDDLRKQLDFEREVTRTYLTGAALAEVRARQDTAGTALTTGKKRLKVEGPPPVLTPEQVVRHYLNQADLVGTDEEVRHALRQSMT